MRKTEEYDIVDFFENDIEDKAKAKKKKGKKDKISVFEIFESVVAALVVVTLVFIFCFRVFSVEGPSMRPTLESGDRVVVSTIGYKPEQGDIVVISGTQGIKKPIVKRIIAVAGDKVDINFTTGIVTVNGVEESYSQELTTQQANVAFPIVVPEGTVFVLGDNRDLSKDSRSSDVGCIDERMIVGKVLFRFFPLGAWSVE